MIDKQKTGEVMYHDADGALWLAESWQDTEGHVTTTQMLVEPAPAPGESMQADDIAGTQ